MVAKLVEGATWFGGGVLEQLGVLINHLLHVAQLAMSAAQLLLLLLHQFIVHLQQGLLLYVLQLLVLEDAAHVAQLLLELASAALLYFLVFLQFEDDYVFQDAVEREFADTRLLEVQVLEDGEDAFLDEVESEDLEVHLIELLLLMQLEPLAQRLLEVVLLLLHEGPAVGQLQKPLQLSAVPPLLGLMRQALGQNLEPEVGAIYFFVLLTDEAELQPDQFLLDEGLPIVVLLAHTVGAEQFFSASEHLIESAAERVDVDFGVVAASLVDFGGLVVVGAAVVERLGVLVVAHLGYSEVDQIHALLPALVLID